jgi:subfamily B ATP-binding cassette protein MsbA
MKMDKIRVRHETNLTPADDTAQAKRAGVQQRFGSGGRALSRNLFDSFSKPSTLATAMRHLLSILGFGFPYLRPYAARFVAGVLLAVFFGLSNGALLWAINTVLDRMSPVNTIQSSANTAGTHKASGFIMEWKTKAQTATREFVDPWLPLAGQTPTWQQILGGLLLFPCLAVIRGFTGYLSSYCLAWTSERLVNDLRVDVLKNLSGLSLDFYNKATMGDLITRVTGDTASLQRCLSLGLSDLIKEPVTILGIVGGLCLIDWHLTMAALIFFPLVALPIVYFGRRVRKAATAGLRTTITQSSLLVEIVSGIRVIKAFNLEEQQVERFRKLSREIVHHAMRGIRAKEMMNPIIEAISTFGFGAILVYVVYRGVRLEDMISLLAGVAFIYMPIRKLAGIHVLLQQTHAGVERLMHILREQPTVREPAQPRRLDTFKAQIAFQTVSFSYGHRSVLEAINLTIPRGTKLGVAGESGSGKSTLVNLVFRFYDPTSGAVSIDGIDLREISVRDLRQLMALVSQEIVLFDLTAAENIASGKSGATRAEVEAAARAAYAHEFIAQLPQGYDTRIGERGVMLSVGQRQRIAIARAFIRNAPILVLDEATASLDSQSEAEVQGAIERLEENRTVICVAHRLSTLANMDHIIMLSQGRILEQGDFSELLAAGGVFSAMARKQGISSTGTRAPRSEV